MFGSLVVVFPTSHEGGALLLRHRGREWIFDSSKALAAVDQPTIGYVAFFGDIEHEVAPVTSGHRITLTYNLYFDDGGPVSENDAVSDHLIPPQLPNQGTFHEAFKVLLENPEFMADGGTLAFGLRHVYPIKDNLKHIYNVLKASDAVLYQNMRALGFEPVLYVYYEDNEYYEEGGDTDLPRGAMVDRLIYFDGTEDGESVLDLVQKERGILVRQDGGKICGAFALEDSEPVEWVSPLTTYNRQEGAYASYGNEPTLNWVYGDVCMIVRIGKAGDRLAYPTADQVTEVFRQRWRERHPSRGLYID